MKIAGQEPLVSIRHLLRTPLQQTLYKWACAVSEAWTYPKAIEGVVRMPCPGNQPYHPYEPCTAHAWVGSYSCGALHVHYTTNHERLR